MKEEELSEFNKIYSQGGFYMRKHLEKFIEDLIKKKIEEMVELFTKKTQNEKGEPICPKCGQDMERDVQEPQGYLWFCKCSPSLRLSVG